MENKKYLVYLHYIGFNHNILNNIFIKNKNNYKDIFEEKNYYKFIDYGLNKKQILKIIKNKKNINTQLILKKIINLDIKIIICNEDNFPEELKNIYNPPYFIYIKGKIPIGRNFGVIGSREITNYGIQAIENIVPILAKHFIIISGGASGCDTYAHKYANYNTIVIIGTGIDISYPKENKSLFDKITKNGGAIISIFPIGEQANRYNFPIRNEIIAGLSEGILVIEAKEQSGSLITVRLALEIGKDIFALPGNIFNSQSNGTNKLIKKGEAKLVTKYQDILEEYNFEKNGANKNIKQIIQNYSENEIKIINLIKETNLNMNEISTKTGFNILETSTIISEMEIKGILKKDIFQKYSLINLI